MVEDLRCSLPEEECMQLPVFGFPIKFGHVVILLVGEGIASVNVAFVRADGETGFALKIQIDTPDFGANICLFHRFKYLR